MHKILIIEDDPVTTELIRTGLDPAGYDLVSCADSSDALFCLQTDSFDVILLDISLHDPAAPDMMEKLCGRETPVIFLIGRENAAEQVRSLRLGANGWVRKPPEAIELLTRIDVALRQTGQTVQCLSYHDIDVDLHAKSIKQAGAEIRLTPKEFELLVLFIQHIDIALSREKILQMVWGYCVAGETRTVDMHIMQLRKKLDFHKRLKTVIKVGYRLDH